MRGASSILIALLIIGLLPCNHAQNNTNGNQTSQPTPPGATNDPFSHVPSAHPSSHSNNIFKAPQSLSMNPTKADFAPPVIEAATLSPESQALLATCQNTPGFIVDSFVWMNHRMGCDDFRLVCEDLGNLGAAKDHCCKCKGQDCKDFCNETEWNVYPAPSRTSEDEIPDDDSGDVNIILVVGSSLAVVFCFGTIYFVLKFCSKTGRAGRRARFQVATA